MNDDNLFSIYLVQHLMGHIYARIIICVYMTFKFKLGILCIFTKFGSCDTVIS